MNMEEACSSDPSVTFNELHGAISQEIELFITAALRTSDVFPVRYELNSYILFRSNLVFNPSVEAGSNTTIVLRVVGGDEKVTQCLVYNWTTLFLGDINMGTWPSGMGEYRF